MSRSRILSTLLCTTVSTGMLLPGAAAAGQEAASGRETARDMPRGLLSATPAAADGYVYFASLIGSTTYLLESASGAVVHTWESRYAPAGSVYLLDNGNLIRGSRLPNPPVFSAGGQGGRLEERTWDGELVWSWVLADERALLHHDFKVMPNGNILAIAWESKSLDEARTAGSAPEWTPEQGLWPDMILEIERDGPYGARVVWQWHAWDHLIQDTDPSLPNYGDPSEHPERIDVNGGDRSLPEAVTDERIAEFRRIGYVPSDDDEWSPTSDLMHSNAIAYNAELDQIALSVNAFSEIWIIDHSTTTEEAASRSGGRWGKGGDLLYRWGRPQAYGREQVPGLERSRQHDVRWIPEGMPGAGNLLLYANNVAGEDGMHSEIFELAPPTAADGSYVIPAEGPIGPLEPAWRYVASPDPDSFHSPFISGAHRLSDGNTLITSGGPGRFFEVTPDGDIVWEYRSPTSGSVDVDGALGGAARTWPYGVFRATKIAPDHPALRGRMLRPLDPQPEWIPPLEPTGGGG